MANGEVSALIQLVKVKFLMKSVYKENVMFCFVLPSHFTFLSLQIGFLLVWPSSSEANY